jgi:hypothetical protein
MRKAVYNYFIANWSPSEAQTRYLMKISKQVGKEFLVSYHHSIADGWDVGLALHAFINLCSGRR